MSIKRLTWKTAEEDMTIDGVVVKRGDKYAFMEGDPQPGDGIYELTSVNGKKVKRPALRYHGGKWRIAPWIISHFPEHRIYVEPFGGAASVLLRKERCYAEIYNDLDDEIVEFFTVVRDAGELLQKLLKNTPFARTEFLLSYGARRPNMIDRARMTVIKSFMGFGSDSIRRKSGFRADSHRSGTTPAHDWANYVPAMDMLIERMQGVTIEKRPAIDVILKNDTDQTLFYVDPPYVHSTRSGVSNKAYRHEMDDAAHRQLAKVLHGVKGKVVLSAYDCPLYQELYGAWRSETKAARADGGRARTEIIYFNF